MSEEVKHMGRWVYRHKGVFDWELLYKESRQFFVRVLGSEIYFKERRYKHKDLQIEVQWVVKHYYDAYSMWLYNVTLKVVDPILKYKTIDGKQRRFIEGNLRIWVTYDYIGNYETHSFGGGQKQLFRQGSLLQRLYWKLTWRDRYDLAEDLGMFFVHDFIELIKKLVGGETGGYASIGEPW